MDRKFKRSEDVAWLQVGACSCSNPACRSVEISIIDGCVKELVIQGQKVTAVTCKLPAELVPQMIMEMVSISEYGTIQR